ncbi:MAG TPA: type II secretion system F family protein [Burkholderiaceae bacterium]|nr:type II secretion system F family protein [Burkholderiaceae bacterium]
MDFSYRAIDASGRVVTGRMPAMNERELEARLKQTGLEVIDARSRKAARFAPLRRVQRRELIGFCYHMEQTLRGGVLLTDALADLVEGTADRGFRDVLSAMLESVREGSSLSMAMTGHPQAFDEVFIGLIRAGEQSGQLFEAFARIGASLRWQDELTAKLKKIVSYPAFTLVVLLAVASFMLIYLVPQLSGFIKSTSGGELPLQTRILLSLSEAMVAHWPWFLAAPVLFVFLVWAGLRRAGPALRLRLDRLKLRVPLAGSIVEKVALARFASLFGMLYAAGVPVLTSLEVCRGAAGNQWIAHGIARVRELIVDGSGMTEAFQKTQLFPNLVLRMVRIGETTGELDAALANVTYFYNREVEETLQRVQAVIEPMLTVSLGLLLAWLMMAVLGPVYDLIAKVKI